MSNLKTKILYSLPLVESQLPLLKKRVAHLKSNGVIPRLKVFLVGDNSSSLSYVKKKQELCSQVGALCEIIQFDKTVSSEHFLGEISKANEDSQLHGAIIQLPIPEHLQKLPISEIILPTKDVDGFHPQNIYRLFSNSPGLWPCTPIGIVELLKYYGKELAGKRIAIVGRSLIVGKPLSLLLCNHDATVTLCHGKTNNLQEITKDSDIVIVAIGRAKFIDETYFNPIKKTWVIDVGTNRDETGKMCGDVDFVKVAPVVGAISPVPGGVGPLTVLSLITNLVIAAELQAGVKGKHGF